MRTKNILTILCCALICASINVNAQTASKPHVVKLTTYEIYNFESAPIWIGPHSNTAVEKSGITTWTRIDPKEHIAINVSVDSTVVIRKNGVKKNYSKLAFRLTADTTKTSTGQDYLLSFSKKKNVIFVDYTTEAAKSRCNSPEQRGIGFSPNQAPDNTVIVGALVNNSSLTITFTDPRHPFYGKTLGPKDSLGLNSSTRKKLVSTGLVTSEISVIREEGDNAIPMIVTLPILEGSESVVLTDNFFDLATEGWMTNKVYPTKIRIYSKVDVVIEGAYDSKGKSMVYALSGGPKGTKGKIIYLIAGENYINLKYTYQKRVTQPLTIIATDGRGTKYLKLDKSGKFIVDLVE